MDPALVHHYFGTKDRLLVAAIQESRLVGEAIRQMLAGGSEGLGERVIRATVEAYETLPILGALIGLFRSALTNEDAARLMGELFPRGGVAQLIEALDLPQPELRAALVGSEVIGLAVARFLVRLEPIASADVDSLVAWYAPTLQRYLTEPLPGDEVHIPER